MNDKPLLIEYTDRLEHLRSRIDNPVSAEQRLVLEQEYHATWEMMLKDYPEANGQPAHLVSDEQIMNSGIDAQIIGVNGETVYDSQTEGEQ